VLLTNFEKMKPIEKAKQIVDKFIAKGYTNKDEIIEMASIGIDLVIDEYDKMDNKLPKIFYWHDVKSALKDVSF
jgi:hypothetical protein